MAKVVARKPAGGPPLPAAGPSEPRLADLVPDAHNRRTRTPRGAKMLAESLAKVGAARSIVIDEVNGVLAGNGLLEAAAEAGITKLKVVEADGDTIIAVRRTGLSETQKRELAMYDNRTGELAEWAPDQLAADKAAGVDLAPWFNPGEQRQQLGTFGPEPKVVEVETSTVGDQFWIAITGPLAAQAQALQRLRELMADLKDVAVELGTTPTPDAWTG